MPLGAGKLVLACRRCGRGRWLGDLLPDVFETLLQSGELLLEAEDPRFLRGGGRGGRVARAWGWAGARGGGRDGRKRTGRKKGDAGREREGEGGGLGARRPPERAGPEAAKRTEEASRPAEGSSSARTCRPLR